MSRLVGHRRRLLDAIAALGATAPAAVLTAAPSLVHRHKSMPNAGS